MSDKMEREPVLLEGAQRFDEQALAEIYDHYSSGIYRYAMRLLGDANLAEDCVAETFSRFLVALKHGKGPKKYLQAYLYRIAHNWITDIYRRQPPPPLSLEPDLHSDPEAEPSKIVHQELEIQKVRAALAYLTPDQRLVVVLKYLESWGNAEIAAALDKPVGAIKSLHHRAINALRRILLAEHEEVR
ncbi:MAG: sigma-70 family RNA polymerase sigma factor [Anaerolineales bacterium]|jgi:RNA polymerase sigma-70 factor (ECF subfamily)